MDGLLLNTQTMYSSVSARILAKHGKEPDFDFKVIRHNHISLLGRPVIQCKVEYFGYQQNFKNLFIEKLKLRLVD